MDTGLNPSHLLGLKFSEFFLIHKDIILDKVLRFIIKLHDHLNYVVVSRSSFIGEVCAHTK